MRLAFLVNSDKSIHAYAITGGMLPESRVIVTFPAPGKMRAFMDSTTPDALDDAGRVLLELAKLGAVANVSPKLVIEGILAAGGKQVCVDHVGKFRCVSTMRDDVSTYVGKDLPELVTSVSISDDADAMLASARVALKREAARLIMDDKTRPDLVDRLVLWVKAGSKTVLATSGKVPTFSKPGDVFGY
jgi:hypothetical protein